MRDPDALDHERGSMQPSGRRAYYDPNQPRVPAGSSDGGQWTDAGERTAYIRNDSGRPQLAQFPLPNTPPIQTPTRPSPPPVRPNLPGLLGVLSLFGALSARNAPGNRAILEFNAREFLRDPYAALDPTNVKQLTRQEVENVCKKLDDVQDRTNRIASTVQANSPSLNAQQYGTAVHTHLAYEINEPRRPDNSPKDPNYRAEVSYWKMREDHVYGRKDSIRIDVFENAGRNVVCVYDIKTGQSRRSGLGFGRMLEIAKHVLGAYPNVERVIITEVRPHRR
jgi:hypothetical protein